MADTPTSPAENICSPAYSAAEAIQEVAATLAFEGMDLTEEDVRLLCAYRNGDVSGDALRQQILGGG